jgi:tetratricopeptide (TPR) repeat protein
MKQLFTIDNILNELSKRDGNLIIFCGAGISINSGLPAAIPLLDEVLTCLEVDLEDKDKLIRSDWTLAMPFEMFFETFLENTNDHQMLDIFKDGSPSTNHLLISKCHQFKLLNEVYTTNFDLLIEKAFESNKEELLVFKNEESFAEIDDPSLKCKLIKVHGSIDNIESIRTTLSTITKKSLTTEREKIIDRIFGTSDANKRILILGYSCSDIFDIVPKIEKVFNPKVSIYLIEHNKHIDKKEDVIIEDINFKKENNPFKKYKGKLIKVNTDSFNQWFWNEIDSEYIKISDINENWKKHIEEWTKGFHSYYLKFTIIGQLFYRISNFNLALKYHQKALDVNKNGNKRGEGASYSNIGLIYHDLKEYDKAIIYFEKANSIFNEIDFHYGKAATYTNMGSSYIYLPNKIKALINLKKSLRISRQQDFREKKLCESDALCNFGLLYEKSGEYPNAIYFYSLTLDIDKQGNKSGEAQTLSDMGRVYKLMGNYRESIKLFTTSNDIAIKLGMQSLIFYTNQQIEEIRLKMTECTTDEGVDCPVR